MIHSSIVVQERLRLAVSELSVQQEKNVNSAEEYSDMVDKLEHQRREDGLEVNAHSCGVGLPFVHCLLRTQSANEAMPTLRSTSCLV